MHTHTIQPYILHRDIKGHGLKACTNNAVDTIVYYMYYTVLYYTILYYTILCYTVLYCTVLYYTILYYTVLYCTILYYTILYYTILYYTILHYMLHYTIHTHYTIQYHPTLYNTYIHTYVHTNTHIKTYYTVLHFRPRGWKPHMCTPHTQCVCVYDTHSHICVHHIKTYDTHSPTFPPPAKQHRVRSHRSKKCIRGAENVHKQLSPNIGVPGRRARVTHHDCAERYRNFAGERGRGFESFCRL